MAACGASPGPPADSPTITAHTVREPSPPDDGQANLDRADANEAWAVHATGTYDPVSEGDGSGACEGTADVTPRTGDVGGFLVVVDELTCSGDVAFHWLPPRFEIEEHTSSWGIVDSDVVLDGSASCLLEIDDPEHPSSLDFQCYMTCRGDPPCESSADYQLRRTGDGSTP